MMENSIEQQADNIDQEWAKGKEYADRELDGKNPRRLEDSPAKYAIRKCFYEIKKQNFIEGSLSKWMGDARDKIGKLAKLELERKLRKGTGVVSKSDNPLKNQMPRTKSLHEAEGERKLTPIGQKLSSKFPFYIPYFSNREEEKELERIIKRNYEENLITLVEEN